MSITQLASPRILKPMVPLGLVFCAFFGSQIRREEALVRDTVPVRAEVLSGEVVDSVSGTGQARERTWKPVVRFRYVFEGRTLESDRVTPLDEGGSRSWARELVERFPPGRRVEARVSRDDPEKAFLVAPRSWKPRIGLALGVLVAIGAAVTLVFRGRRSAPAGS